VRERERERARERVRESERKIVKQKKQIRKNDFSCVKIIESETRMNCHSNSEILRVVAIFTKFQRKVLKH